MTISRMIRYTSTINEQSYDTMTRDLRQMQEMIHMPAPTSWPWRHFRESLQPRSLGIKNSAMCIAWSVDMHLAWKLLRGTTN